MSIPGVDRWVWLGGVQVKAGEWRKSVVLLRQQARGKR